MASNTYNIGETINVNGEDMTVVGYDFQCSQIIVQDSTGTTHYIPDNSQEA